MKTRHATIVFVETEFPAPFLDYHLFVGKPNFPIFWFHFRIDEDNNKSTQKQANQLLCLMRKEIKQKLHERLLLVARTEERSQWWVFVFFFSSSSSAASLIPPLFALNSTTKKLHFPCYNQSARVSDVLEANKWPVEKKCLLHSVQAINNRQSGINHESEDTYSKIAKMGSQWLQGLANVKNKERLLNKYVLPQIVTCMFKLSKRLANIYFNKHEFLYIVNFIDQK